MKNSLERTERLLNAYRQLQVATRIEAQQIKSLIEESKREVAVAERYLNEAVEGGVPPLLIVRRLAACEDAVQRNTILLDGLSQKTLELAKIELLLKKRLDRFEDEKFRMELRSWLAEAIDAFIEQADRNNTRNHTITSETNG